MRNWILIVFVFAIAFLRYLVPLGRFAISFRSHGPEWGLPLQLRMEPELRMLFVPIAD